jgi:endonuclease/exonuclease/phosphatase family metal-dependent hydrolase
MRMRIWASVGVCLLAAVSCVSGEIAEDESGDLGFESQAVSAPWTAVDIGNVVQAGTTTDSNGVFTSNAGGSAIWNTADGFHFVYQPLTGNGTITARVAAVTLPANATNAGGGVMFRESLAAGSRHASALTFYSGKSKLYARSSTNGTSSATTGFTSGQAPPRWVRLTRSGDVISGWISTDGTSWTSLDNVTLTGLPATMYVGFVAVREGGTNLTTVTTSNVGVVPASTGATPLKVLTWNTHKCVGTDGIKSCARVANTINATAADVALLSAVQTQTDSDAIKTALGAGWSCYFARVSGEGQSVCSRWGYVAGSGSYQQTAFVSGQYEYQCIVHAVVNIGGDTSKPVHFFAIDQDHASAPVRQQQAIDMSAYADAFSGMRIVGGDFNEPSGNATTEWRTTYHDDYDYFDVTLAGTPALYGTNTDGRTRKSRLDHILSAKTPSGWVSSFTLTAARVHDLRTAGTTCSDVVDKLGSCSACGSCTYQDDEGVRGSDHIPLTVTFSIN